LRKSWWIQNWVTTVAPSLQCLRCKGIGKFIFFWLCIVSFVKKNDGSVEKYTDFSVGLILMGDLPKWKTWKCFQYWSCEIHESDFRLMLWNTWKWFQHWFFFFFFVKYMKVISTMVLWNAWKWFQHLFYETHESDFRLALWNIWKWFQQWFCEIHESDFNICFLKHMKVISD